MKHFVKQHSYFKQKLALLKYGILRAELAVTIFLIMLIIFFTILNPLFFSWENFTLVMTMSSELGLIAIGLAFLIISGEFDLSIGAVFALIPLTVILLNNFGINLVIAMLIGMLLSISIGAINGFISLYAKIPSFITTLGTMFVIRGILLLITGGFPVKYRGISHIIMLVLGGDIFHGLRASIIWFIIMTIILTVILERTPYGNMTYAVGGNPKVAEELGVNSRRIKLINFILCSFLAGLSGAVALERLKMVDPLLGSGMELEAFATATLGGCFLSGGYGSIVGTSLAAILVTMIYSGLVIIGIPAYWYKGITGMILLIAAFSNEYITKIIMKRK